MFWLWLPRLKWLFFFIQIVSHNFFYQWMIRFSKKNFLHCTTRPIAFWEKKINQFLKLWWHSLVKLLFFKSHTRKWNWIRFKWYAIEISKRSCHCRKFNFLLFCIALNGWKQNRIWKQSFDRDFFGLVPFSFLSSSVFFFLLQKIWNREMCCTCNQSLIVAPFSNWLFCFYSVDFDATMFFDEWFVVFFFFFLFNVSAEKFDFNHQQKKTVQQCLCFKNENCVTSQWGRSRITTFLFIDDGDVKIEKWIVAVKCEKCAKFVASIMSKIESFVSCWFRIFPSTEILITQWERWWFTVSVIFQWT